MNSHSQPLILDPAIRDWVLIPIMVVMVLIGVLRHYLTQLLELSSSSPTKTATLNAIREQQILLRGRLLRQSADWLPFYAFQARRDFFGQLTWPTAETPADGQSEDAMQQQQQQMDVMMEGMKKNMAMMVPQMVMMGWVNYFFSGFVLSLL